MTALSVNLNKVATLRNTRTIGIPSVVHAAEIVLDAGADGITVHPRPDGRHVRGADVAELAALLRDWPACEFNIEGNPFHGLLDFVADVHPHQCTFVPDETGAFTSDHGWNLPADCAARPDGASRRALRARVSACSWMPIPGRCRTPQRWAPIVSSSTRSRTRRSHRHARRRVHA